MAKIAKFGAQKLDFLVLLVKNPKFFFRLKLIEWALKSAPRSVNPTPSLKFEILVPELILNGHPTSSHSTLPSSSEKYTARNAQNASIRLILHYHSYTALELQIIKVISP